MIGLIYIATLLLPASNIHTAQAKALPREEALTLERQSSYSDYCIMCSAWFGK